MNDIPPETVASQFFSVAVELGYITTEQSSELLPEALKSEQAAADFALNSGALTATQVDAVKTLCHPEDVIPGYRIESLLGQGGMGVVYRAEQLNLRRQVAIKTILVSRMGDQNALHRFEREAQTIGQLRHPNIIAAFDFGRYSGRFYLALELVDGEDLSLRIKKHGPFDEATSLGLIRQAAAGLAHAAVQHVVHRDIKPANLILVDPPEGYPLPPGMPMVKIADFGLALLQSDVDDSTRLTRETTLGSPHYMAPEQFESSDVGFRADMYSLGATLVEILTGKPPFQGMKLSQLLAAKFSNDENVLKNLPSSLKPATVDLVRGLMSVKPTDRPENYEKLIQQIDDVIAGGVGVTETILLDSVQNQSSNSNDSTKEFTLKEPSSSESREAERFSARFLLIVSAVVFVGAVLSFVMLGRGHSSNHLKFIPLHNLPQVETVGQSHQLFNGIDTGGWEIGHGSWIWDLKKAVLEGTGGLISRPIPNSSVTEKSLHQPCLWYRLEILFAPFPKGESSENVAQELLFGVNEEGDSRFVLRRSQTEVEFLVRNSEDNETSRVYGDQSTLSVSGEKMVAVTLDRLPDGWVLEVNGKPFNTVRSPHSEELPEFQLKAVGGPVYFADAVLTELSTE